MFDPSWPKTEVNKFRGAWTNRDVTDVPTGKALTADNCVFVPGAVGPRTGFGQAYNSNEAATALYNWNSHLGNNLLWWKSGTGLRRIDVAAAAPAASTILSTASGYAASFADAGARVYTAIFGTDSLGATHGHCVGYHSFTVAGGTLTNVVVSSDVGTVTTPGTHGLTAGDVVYITGETADTDLNGTYTIATSASTTTFTIATASVANGTYIACTVSTFIGDKLFAPPMTYAPSAPSEPSAGTITEGTHYAAYAVEYRGGFIGRLCPDSGVGTPSLATFSPVTFAAAGSKNASWVLNPTAWPEDAVKVHVAMTAASNPNLYVFVPGAYAAVTGGASDSTTIVFDIPDEDLLAVSGTSDATDNRLLMTQTVAGVAPFSPHAVFPVGDRMAYVTTLDDNQGNKEGALVVSNRGAFQEISLDHHIIQLPGRKPITTGCFLLGQVYLFGEDGTYVTHDNGQHPSQWGTPAIVDGKRGTPSVRGVEVAPSGNIAWVVDKTGLYAFNGQYTSQPISYENDDEWSRINWSYAHTIQVEDDAQNKRVLVAAPLDDETTPSHLLTWDYKNGIDSATVDFSLWSFYDYDIGAIEIVLDDLTGAETGNATKPELWIAPSGTDYIVRQKTSHDDDIYQDQSAKIVFKYETALLPQGHGRYFTLQHHGGYFRATGSGRLTITALSMDNGWSETLSPIDLSTAPGMEYQRGFYGLAEKAYYRFEQSTAGAYCSISGIVHHFSDYGMQR